MIKHISENERETKELAKRLAINFKAGDIICLHGELGAGKTAFVKGVAEILNIKMEVTSPTFTLMNIYKIEPQINQIERLIHIDTYRLKNSDELLEIGAEDYIGEKNNLTIIEWPDKIQELLENKKVMNITIHHLEKDKREITVE